jgi:uncharacterized repeat protein (TIGR03803 family)
MRPIFLVTLVMLTGTWTIGGEPQKSNIEAVDTPKVQEAVLHSFSHNDGALPLAAVTFDSAGNLYGTTWQGGQSSEQCGSGGCGVVFQLVPNRDGTWNENVLYNFQGEKDGGFSTAGVVIDKGGNLYGTTYDKGAYNFGVVLKLTPNGDGTWTEKVLHTFKDKDDGGTPLAGLTLDASGNLYGSAAQGGVHGKGTVFKLTPSAGDRWKFTTLYSFRGGKDGFYPYAPPVFDAAGNLYGTTFYGGGSGCYGNNGCGTVFRLMPKSGGGWRESVLHRFRGEHDGAAPQAGLILDGVGNLYGTATGGGAHGEGVAFKLTQTSSGRWTEKVIRAFWHGYPYAGLIFDSLGNLYGTTSHGFVYELTPISGGSWKESVLHFCDERHGDGATPMAGLIFDSSGNLYGTTENGGEHGFGVVFTITNRNKVKVIDVVLTGSTSRYIFAK